MSSKFVQIASVKISSGDNGVAVIALDERGRLWSNHTLYVQGGTSNWGEWELLPPLPSSGYALDNV